MTEFRIVAVRLTPWWKKTLSLGDNLEAVIEDDRGNRKTVTVLDSQPFIKSLFKEYIAKKHCTGNQFWKPPSKKVEKPKISKKDRRERLLAQSMKVIGESFDCAIVLSEEAE